MTEIVVLFYLFRIFIMEKKQFNPNNLHASFGIRTKGKRLLLLSSNGKEVNSMEQSSSYDEQTIQHQFDRKCKLALQGEENRLRKASFLPPETWDFVLWITENRILETFHSRRIYCRKLFSNRWTIWCEDKKWIVGESNWNADRKKKGSHFLSYFQGMSDAAIARKLNLVRSTVCEHRTRSLELLKNTMEEYGYENYR